MSGGSSHKSNHEFFEASGNLSRRKEGATWEPLPLLIVSMSSQLVIPGGLLSSRAHLRFTNREPLCDWSRAVASVLKL